MSPLKCYTTGRMMDVFPKDVSGSSPKFGKYRINWQTIERVNDVLYLTLRESQLITNYRSFYLFQEVSGRMFLLSFTQLDIMQSQRPLPKLWRSYISIK